MRIADSVTVPATRAEVWAAILDGGVLGRAIPGCERLVATGEHEYDMTVTAGVASIRGTYDGHCRLTDLHEQESLVMTLSGSGAPGTVEATVQVSLGDTDGGTSVAYDADATVGGMVGGVGQRMLTSVSKRMAREFFGNLHIAMTSAVAPQAAATRDAPATPGTPAYERPARAVAAPGGFWQGVATGAGLVLLGVAAGWTLGRRR